jgi:hypothetical protein
MPNTPTEIARETLALSEKATPGPWAARPNKYDDWGFIRSENGSLTVVARAGQCMDEKDDAYCRATSKDPTQHNMDFVVFARNNAPALASAVLEMAATVGAYATAARVILLHLGEFVPENLTCDEGIAEAARRAAAEIERLRDCERIAWVAVRGRYHRRDLEFAPKDTHPPRLFYYEEMEDVSRTVIFVPELETLILTPEARRIIDAAMAAGKGDARE